MNFLKKVKKSTVIKIIRISAVVLAGLGFFFILGAVGHSDYMTEIGKYYPIHKTFVKMLIGCVMLLPAWFIYADEDDKE